MIQLRSISKAYNEVKILNKISINFDKGTMTAIVGQSGSGKSTLLNIIGLLDSQDSGDLFIDSELVETNTKQSLYIQRNDISYLFQNFALVDNLTVEDNLNIALEYSKQNKKTKQQNIRDALKKVGLSGTEKRLIYTLSGGEQQRVAMARVILRNSKIILCDEPTGSLDEINGAVILDLLKELKNKGKTIIIVTHDLNVANQCDRIIQLDSN